MICFVTGASGFVGANLVHELEARGHTVKALLRPNADLRGLEGAQYEFVEGDLSNRKFLADAMRGCDWVFHVAASYQLWMRDYRPMYAANVEGTRNVIQAATDAGIPRVVYTSTVGCIAVPQSGAGEVIPSNEECYCDISTMTNDYKRSKFQAEQVALELADKGAPVVIVNPTAPIGPRDVKPTPTGKVIVDYLNRAMPGYVDTGLNWVHVRDVCIGHILAAEKGRVGERYILGNAEGNWTLQKAFAVLEELTGIPAPKLKVPFGVALTAAYFSEAIARFTGKPPKAPLGGVRMAKYKMFFDPTKALTDLGLPQTPPEQALADAVQWFREHGYARG
jgi:dihydroflavonol-4-reductase